MRPRSKCLWFLLASSFVISSCSKHGGTIPTLEGSVRQLLDPKNFDAPMLDDNSVVALAPTKHPDRFLTKPQVLEFLSKVKNGSDRYEISNFAVMHKEDSGKYGAITYKFTVKYSAANKTETISVLSHEIWEHEPHGWRRVFAAMEQTQ